MGKLIVFEGIDGSGKSTQLDMLCRRLEKEGMVFSRLTFPQYAEPSSALIKMYLAGEFGTAPGDVSPYAASAFFAVDRYASYVKVWRGYYRDGGVIVSDRYTTSNAIHQGAKLPEEEQTRFFEWLREFEYERMGLPAPDAVVYMDVPLEAALSNIRAREAEMGMPGDIHETDGGYLASCRKTALRAVEHFGWTRMECAQNGKMRPAADIQRDIYKKIARLF